MLTLGIKLTLLLIGLYVIGAVSAAVVLAALLVVTITALNQYLNRKIFTLAAGGLYGIVCFFVPSFSLFLPSLAFDTARYSRALAATLVIPLLLYNPLFVPVFAAAMLFEFLHSTLGETSRRYTHLQDLHTEQKRALVQKTKELTENQIEVAHLAKLSERNRIARDIHDTIGHVLSRAILQTGALQAQNQDTNLNEPLKALQETLASSMESVRKSVHDLKDDAVDLHQEIRAVFEGAAFEIHLHYDMSQTGDIPNFVKNCFLMVAKEALTNTIKHSDATQIKITVQEHPALYQLHIQDNGTRKPRNLTEGMGLQNIAARVKAADGYCSFDYDSGFRIFITLPKESA